MIVINTVYVFFNRNWNARANSFITERGNITSRVKAIYHGKEFHESTQTLPEGAQIGLILDKTNFYAEQGGQENDTGRILIDGKAEFEVDNAQVYAGYVLHTGYIKYGALSVRDEVLCEYDEVCPWN